MEGPVRGREARGVVRHRLRGLGEVAVQLVEVRLNSVHQRDHRAGRRHRAPRLHLGVGRGIEEDARAELLAPGGGGEVLARVASDEGGDRNRHVGDEARLREDPSGFGTETVRPAGFGTVENAAFQHAGLSRRELRIVGESERHGLHAARLPLRSTSHGSGHVDGLDIHVAPVLFTVIEDQAVDLHGRVERLVRDRLERDSVAHIRARPRNAVAPMHNEVAGFGGRDNVHVAVAVQIDLGHPAVFGGSLHEAVRLAGEVAEGELVVVVVGAARVAVHGVRVAEGHGLLLHALVVRLRHRLAEAVGRRQRSAALGRGHGHVGKDGRIAGGVHDASNGR